MKQDLIELSEQFPGLTVTVKLEDLLSAGRTLNAELLDSIASTRVEVPVQTSEPDELLTKEETCRTLGVSNTTLWRWSQNGYLTPVKVGVQVRYRRSDIAHLIERKGGAL